MQIVLLHGLTGSRRIFAGLETRLRAWPTRADTLSFDLPGFGTNKELDGSGDIASHLRFISDSMANRFPVGPLVLMGHSLGGVLALAWASEHRQRVSQIVLLNAPLGESREDVIQSLLQERVGWGALLLKHRSLAHLACVLLRGAHLIRLFRFAKPAYVTDAVFFDYTQHSWKSVARMFDEVLLAVPGGPLIRQIVDIPILNLTGEADDEIFRRRIAHRNVRNVTLPGGHLMLLEHPDATGEAIMSFLSPRHEVPTTAP